MLCYASVKESLHRFTNCRAYIRLKITCKFAYPERHIPLLWLRKVDNCVVKTDNESFEAKAKFICKKLQVIMIIAKRNKKGKVEMTECI